MMRAKSNWFFLLVLGWLLTGCAANVDKVEGGVADLTKADLNGVIERMAKHKPPRPPATSAKGAWRASAVATAVGKALYTQVAQSDDDDDDDADGAESESDSEGDAAETPTPWQEQVETAVKVGVEEEQAEGQHQAAGGAETRADRLVDEEGGIVLGGVDRAHLVGEVADH